MERNLWTVFSASDQRPQMLIEAVRCSWCLNEVSTHFLCVLTNFCSYLHLVIWLSILLCSALPVMNFSRVNKLDTSRLLQSLSCLLIGTNELFTTLNAVLTDVMFSNNYKQRHRDHWWEERTTWQQGGYSLPCLKPIYSARRPSQRWNRLYYQCLLLQNIYSTSSVGWFSPHRRGGVTCQLLILIHLLAAMDDDLDPNIYPALLDMITLLVAGLSWSASKLHRELLLSYAGLSWRDRRATICFS